MIERIIEYSVRQRFLVVLVALVVAGLGVYSLWHTPVDAIPDLSENQVIVFADWPGRSPREVEDQLTYPLSVNLQGLAGIKAVRATSEFGFSMVNIIFEERIDYYFARQRVLERLTLAETFLPAGARAYLAPDATALGQIFWYTVEGDGYDLGELRAVQDWFLRYQLASVPGVAEAASVGGFPIEYQIDVDPTKLRAYGVTLGELFAAVSQSNAAFGGRVIQKSGAEYLVRGVGWIQALADVENTIVKSVAGTPVYVSQVAAVQRGSGPRRAALEKDGREVVGGVVLMRVGENPLAVTQRIKEKIAQLQPGLPPGVRILPFYDRTRLITDAIDTLSGTLIEEMIVTSLAVLLILRHFRSALLICLTLPLAILFSFILMRYLGVPSNIMSLSGIAISIGELVDSSFVMVENATHHLHGHFGSRKVTGDTRAFVLPALKTVGRPLFFSVMIMVISFIPVFALSGMEGRMFRPLAMTKTFAMVGVAILAITLVPALVPTFVRGRLRGEQESWIVRRFGEVYRPVLGYLLTHRWPIVWLTAAIFVVGLAPLGNAGLYAGVLALMSAAVAWSVEAQEEAALKRRWRLIAALWLFAPLIAAVFAPSHRLAFVTLSVGVPVVCIAVWLLARIQLLGRSSLAAALLLVAFSADRHMSKLGREFMPPLDEGSILDMPTSVPRTSITQAADDLKARDAWLRLFPEIELVVGKVGRAETPTDPAPPDMVETIVNLRPRAHWPRRKLPFNDALEQSRIVLQAIEQRGWIGPIPDEHQRNDLLNRATMAALERFDETMRALAKRRFVEGEQQRSDHPDGNGFTTTSNIATINAELLSVGAAAYCWHAQEALLTAATDAGLRPQQPPPADPINESTNQRINAPSEAARQTLQAELNPPFLRRAMFWQSTKDELLREMDTLIQMPGWGNIWTQPIINRVDMLASGVRTMIGVKVYGNDLKQIQQVANDVAALLKAIPGAVDVFPDQIVGEGYLEITIDRQKAARYGVSVADVQNVIETALGGKEITMTVEGRQRFPVRIRYARDFRSDEEDVANLLVSAGARATNVDTAPSMPESPAMSGVPAASPPQQVPLGQVADVRIVEGPSMIKSENGLLRAYVQLNVRDRDLVGFVEEAQRAVADKVNLPAGIYLEWSGQFEHQVRARKRLQVILPIVIALIFLILYLTSHDFADAVLMMIAVPGAVAGGVLFQWLFGFNFSVAVWVGFIACFGLATSTGIIMLVYLREAVEKAGGLAHITLEQLRQAVIDGAVHRLRPKLLTEGTTIIGLAPMLWATGTGAEIMRPMAAPVLGGILVADEVIDLLLPVLFYYVRKRRWLRLHGGEVSLKPVAEASRESVEYEAVIGPPEASPI